MFDVSITLLCLACIVMAFSAAVQTAMGFGMALIAVPVLLLIDTAMVPAPVVMSAFVQLVVATWMNRENIQWSLIKYAFIGRIPGTLVAMALLASFAETGLKVSIAVAVLLAVVLSLAKVKVRPSKINHLIAGFFSGITGTTSGIGGPPIALLYQYQRGDVVRANLSAFFLVGSVISLIGMGLVGFVSVTSWLYGALFLPSTFIGVWLGSKLKSRLKAEFMRPALLTLCSASAIAVLTTILFT